MVARQTLLCVLMALTALSAPLVQAHDARPAYLQVDQVGLERYAIQWRTPKLSGNPLPVLLELPPNARNVIEPVTQHLSDSTLERRVVEIPGGLAGRRIAFPGLQATITDVLVRVQLLGELATTSMVRPSQAWMDVADVPDALSVAGIYLLHGIEHILFGYDHLLFVLALLLIVRSTRVLVWTITSFTVAHSITLALAVLGVAHVPGPPVEAVIALSILLLACEIVRIRRGQPTLTWRWPWVVAFVFGLLHGFGFAGALSDVGLPPGDIPLALFAFNVGVELGQLAFVAAVLLALAMARALPMPAAITRHAQPAAGLVVGSLAAFWLVERVAAFWA